MAPPSWWPLTTHYLFAEGMVTFDTARWRVVTRAGSEHQEPLQAPDNPYTPVYRDLLRRLDGEAARGPAAWESAADVAVVQPFENLVHTIPVQAPRAVTA